jgi:hypothetical protein
MISLSGRGLVSLEMGKTVTVVVGLKVFLNTMCSLLKEPLKPSQEK